MDSTLRRRNAAETPPGSRTADVLLRLETEQKQTLKDLLDESERKPDSTLFDDEVLDQVWPLKNDLNAAIILINVLSARVAAAAEKAEANPATRKRKRTFMSRLNEASSSM